jgi:hypothetical protein
MRAVVLAILKNNDEMPSARAGEALIPTILERLPRADPDGFGLSAPNLAKWELG